MEFRSTHAVFYTTLDTIFDTRLTLLNILFPKFMVKLLDQEGGYVHRLKDIFEVDGVKIGYDAYLPHYERRHKGILKYSGLTFIPYVIASEVNRHQYNNFNGDCFKSWEIHVNTYPYLLTNEEKDNVTQAFSQFLQQDPNVIYHHLSTDEVSDDFLSTYEIEVIFDYHGLEWLNSMVFNNGSNFLKRKVGLCVPKILNTSGLEIKDIKDDIFQSLENSFSAYMDVSFLESYAFSDRNLTLMKKIEKDSEDKED